MARKDDYRTLSGTDKAAILMLAIGDEAATKLFKLLDHEEIRDISHTMSNLGQVNPHIVEKLCVEFAERLTSTSSLVGSYDSTEKMLARYMDGGDVANIMDEIRGPVGRTMWDKLANVNETVLAHYLKNEYPQTVAVILSKIKPDHAAKVLTALPENFSNDVIMRMLRLEPVQKEVLDDVERTLRNEFMTNLSRGTRRDSHELIADIFNAMDRASEAKFMTHLHDRASDSAEQIRSLMFTFEDLGTMDNSSVQLLLRNIDKERLIIALKSASEEMIDLFTRNLSQRAGKIMLEDITALGPMRISDIETAQQEIINIAKDLANKGEIILSQPGEVEDIIY